VHLLVKRILILPSVTETLHDKIQ